VASVIGRFGDPDREITTLYYDTGFLIGPASVSSPAIIVCPSASLTAVAALVSARVEASPRSNASNFKEVIVFTLILPVLVLRSLGGAAVEGGEGLIMMRERLPIIVVSRLSWGRSRSS